jgi:hypothetical protein
MDKGKIPLLVVSAISLVGFGAVFRLVQPLFLSPQGGARGHNARKVGSVLSGEEFYHLP